MMMEKPMDLILFSSMKGWGQKLGIKTVKFLKIFFAFLLFFSLTKHQVSAITNDISTFPKPQNDTGIGIFWTGEVFHYDIYLSTITQQISLLKNMDVSWIGMFATPDSMPQSIEFARTMKQNDIEPIVRIWHSQGDASLYTQSELDEISQYIQAGVSYIDIDNEPNNSPGFGGGTCQDTPPNLMGLWTKDALAVQKKGGLPIFPELLPGATCYDMDVLNASFQWLQSNQCQLADGSTNSCLNLFDATHSNGHPAVMGLHTYSWNNDRNPDGSPVLDPGNGTTRFIWYDNVVRQYLGRSVPILSTEGGPAPSAPNGDGRDNYSDVIKAEANFQLQNSAPYFFNTAFWLGLTYPQSPDGQNPFGADAWFDAQTLLEEPTYSPTIDALRSLPKVTRTGGTFPTNVVPTQAPLFSQTNLDGDNCIGISDFNVWFTALKNNVTSGPADINHDNSIDILDFNYWFTAMKTLPSINLCP